MSPLHPHRFRHSSTLAASCFAALVLSGSVCACRGATRGAASPQSTTTTTGAAIAPQIDRVLVSEPGQLTMVARKGCVASLRTSSTQAGSTDELRVRCPKPERLKDWFEVTGKTMASFQLEADQDAKAESEDNLEDSPTPWAKVLIASGKTLKVTRAADVKRLSAEVTTLTAELASAEQPAPGPASPAGWEMLHVTGPAHVLFAGTPTRGFFEARVSTSGQYLCEFITEGEDGPLRATKSGWIAPHTASRAIDEVLVPFNALAPEERSKGTYAAATRGGAEARSSATSTAAVFERFAHVQDALGDACLPELEPPSAAAIGL